MRINLSQYKLLIGENITIDGVEYGTKADVSKICGYKEVEGSITSKHNHTLASAIKLVESLVPDKEEAIDEYTTELIEDGVI